jgi:hypothetical protein
MGKKPDKVFLPVDMLPVGFKAVRRPDMIMGGQVPHLYG